MKHIITALIVLLGWLSTANATDRFLTSKDGRKTYFSLVQRTADNIVAVRKSDWKRFVIPLSSLSESDQKFLATWTPKAEQSSGLMASRSTSSLARGGLQREAYPSNYQPRYSSGGGYRHSTTTGVSRAGCRYMGTRTVTINPCR